jgi:hypothetical protein
MISHRPGGVRVVKIYKKGFLVLKKTLFSSKNGENEH